MLVRAPAPEIFVGRVQHEPFERQFTTREEGVVAVVFKHQRDRHTERRRGAW